MPTTIGPSPAHEDYLKAIFGLSEGAGRASTTALARLLGVKKPSVTSMLKRLAETGHVDHFPRRGVVLTEAGRLHALRVLRRHRLLKCFLVEILGLDAFEVHEEAEVLEHHLSERMLEAMEWVLGNPLEDPHGHPIPDARGRVRARTLAPLGGLDEGAGGIVREVRSGDSARLRRWQELGLQPGAECRVLERQELEDVIHLRVGDRTVATSSEGVAGVYVEPLRQGGQA